MKMGESADSAVPEKATSQRYVLAAILFFTLLVAYLDRVNVSVLVANTQFLTDFGIQGNPVKMGMLMSIFLVAYGLGNVILSPLGDIYGPRKAMSFSIALWTISMFIGGMVTVFSAMLISRVVLGLGEGLHWPMQSKYVSNWFPNKERGKANSLWLLGLMIGPALAMPLFTWVLQAIGWRASFFLLIILGMIPLALLWFFTTDYPRQHKRVNAAERDYIESGQSEQRTEKMDKAAVWSGMKVYLTNYRFWLLTVWYCCNASIFWGTMSWIPSYLKVARGFSWNAMGMWSALPWALGILCLLLSGWLSDKLGRRAPFAMLGHIGVALGIYFAAYATDNVTSAILLSLGTASVAIGLPAVWSLILQIVPGRSVGAAAGMMNGVGNGFSACIPVIMGYFIGTSGYASGLMFLVGAGCIGACCMLILSFQKY